MKDKILDVFVADELTQENAILTHSHNPPTTTTTTTTSATNSNSTVTTQTHKHKRRILIGDVYFNDLSEEWSFVQVLSWWQFSRTLIPTFKITEIIPFNSCVVKAQLFTCDALFRQFQPVREKRKKDRVRETERKKKRRQRERKFGF